MYCFVLWSVIRPDKGRANGAVDQQAISFWMAIGTTTAKNER